MIGRFRTRLARTVIAALGAAALATSAHADEAKTDAAAVAKKKPVQLIELFTSQGCSSCPKANAFLGQLGREPETIALTYAVSYWDYLGWRDTFARPEFTDRQKEYAARFKRGVYTPQMVVDGANHSSGLKPKEMRTMLEKTALAGGAKVFGQRAQDAPEKAKFAVYGTAPEKPTDLWIAQFRPGLTYVTVKHGENAGAKISHYNVVTKLTKVGQFTGGDKANPKRIVADCSPACVMIVQDAEGGPVLTAKLVQGAGAPAAGPAVAAVGN